MAVIMMSKEVISVAQRAIIAIFATADRNVIFSSKKFNLNKKIKSDDIPFITIKTYGITSGINELTDLAGRAIIKSLALKSVVDLHPGSLCLQYIIVEDKKGIIAYLLTEEQLETIYELKTGKK